MCDLPDFDKLRHDKKHHLGLGDVRITMAQQDAITQRIEELESRLRDRQNALDHAIDYGRRMDKHIEELEAELEAADDLHKRDAESYERLEAHGAANASKLARYIAENERLRAVYDAARAYRNMPHFMADVAQDLDEALAAVQETGDE